MRKTVLKILAPLITSCSQDTRLSPKYLHSRAGEPGIEASKAWIQGYTVLVSSLQYKLMKIGHPSSYLNSKCDVCKRHVVVPHSHLTARVAAGGEGGEGVTGGGE